MSVFKVNNDLTVILNRDAVKLVPELSKLNNDEIKYIILVVDYVDSPLRRKPLEERRLMARRMVYKNIKKDPETEKIRLAMTAYKGLIFDIRRETIDIYNTRIRAMQKEMLQPELSIARMRELDASIVFLQDRISSISHQLDIEEEEEVELKGQKKLSYIEHWQKNQKRFREYQSQL